MAISGMGGSGEAEAEGDARTEGGAAEGEGEPARFGVGTTSASDANGDEPGAGPCGRTTQNSPIATINATHSVTRVPARRVMSVRVVSDVGHDCGHERAQLGAAPAGG